jgi:Domain of unknown function (DUF1735)
MQLFLNLQIKYMKLKFLMIPGLFSIIFLSGCLKDSPYMDVSNSAAIIQFGISPANGSTGPFDYKGDTASGPAIDTSIALTIASPQVLTKAVSITVRVDPSQISAYNTANGVSYSLLPSNLYSIKDTVITIAAGYRVGAIPVRLNLPLFPTDHSYALPLSIVNGGGLVISGNSGTFMWLFTR